MSSPMLNMLLSPSRRVGTLVVLAGGVTAVICVWTTLSLQAARSIPVTQAPRPVAEDRLDKSKAAYDVMLATAIETINARAPFGQIKVATKVKEPAKPLVPSSYGGPELTGIADNYAWFRDGKRIKLGEEMAGLKVLSLDPPWSAQLRWAGGEYKVKLFDRSIANLTQSMGVWLGAPPPPPPVTPPPPPTPAPSARPSGPNGPGSPPGGATPAGSTPAGSTPAGPTPAVPSSAPGTVVPAAVWPGAVVPAAGAPGAAPTPGKPTGVAPPQPVPAPIPIPIPEPIPEPVPEPAPEPEPERSGPAVGAAPK